LRKVHIIWARAWDYFEGRSGFLTERVCEGVSKQSVFTVCKRGRAMVRKTHRKQAGKKLYANRNKKGQFTDIQT
jgi:hypothetical protein